LRLVRDGRKLTKTRGQYRIVALQITNPRDQKQSENQKAVVERKGVSSLYVLGGGLVLWQSVRRMARKLRLE
jgi:hypothetical protein